MEGPYHHQIINDSCLQLALVRHWPEEDGLHSDKSIEETAANARLIAASPELLAHCLELVGMVEEMLGKCGPCGWGDIATESARKTIAKVVG
jgi:hypothetical protein